MLTLLATPFARWGGVALLFGAILAWGWAERAGREAATARERAAEAQLRTHAAAMAALERQAAETEARASRSARIRTRIREAPNATACAASPPVRAALDGLRAAVPAGAGQPARLPGAAGTARRWDG